MLEKLLSELRSGGTARVDELALKLDATPSLVQVMLDHLVQLNLVSRYQSCDDFCTDCSASSLCHQDQNKRSANLYYLTSSFQNQ
jgi:DNA-binding IclR family transcriptional regulator